MLTLRTELPLPKYEKVSVREQFYDQGDRRYSQPARCDRRGTCTRFAHENARRDLARHCRWPFAESK